MIIWTTAGLFSLTENTDSAYVNIEARDQSEIDLLKATLRLVDLEDEIKDEFQTTHGYTLVLSKVDAESWFSFEIEHWVNAPLGRQFVQTGDVHRAIALEKLLMNLEK